MQPFGTFSLFESNSIVTWRPQRSNSHRLSDGQWLGTGKSHCCMQGWKCLCDSAPSLLRGSGHQWGNVPTSEATCPPAGKSAEKFLHSIPIPCLLPQPRGHGHRGGLRCAQRGVGAGRRPGLAVKERSPSKPAFLSATAPGKACLTIKALHMYKRLCYFSIS